MRLDKYLKVSRIIKRRTVSNDACDAGRVQVNGKQQKAGYQVKIGDIIQITFGEKTHQFKILLTDDVVARKLGEPMFEEV
jgi:ribosomal 50S subunit-recycling heat shock protein